MAKGVQNINRLKCWPDLAAAGFALESFRGPDMRVNCVGAKGPAGVLIYKNEESDVRPWVVSLSGENEESVTVASGRELLPLLRRVRPALFQQVTEITVWQNDGGGIQFDFDGPKDRVKINWQNDGGGAVISIRW